MAIGDDAKAAGYPLVPGSGEEGKIKFGAREINRTRDMIAQVAQQTPRNRDSVRALANMSYGTFDPQPGDGIDGEIFFRLI